MIPCEQCGYRSQRQVEGALCLHPRARYGKKPFHFCGGNLWGSTSILSNTTTT